MAKKRKSKTSDTWKADFDGLDKMLALLSSLLQTAPEEYAPGMLAALDRVASLAEKGRWPAAVQAGILLGGMVGTVPVSRLVAGEENRVTRQAEAAHLAKQKQMQEFLTRLERAREKAEEAGLRFVASVEAKAIADKMDISVKTGNRYLKESRNGQR